MSYARAAARREKRQVEKLARRKDALGVVGRLEQKTQRVGRVLGFCIFSKMALDLNMLKPSQIDKVLAIANQNSTIMGNGDGMTGADVAYAMWHNRVLEVTPPLDYREYKDTQDQLYWSSLTYFVQQAFTCMIMACNYLYGWSWYSTGRGKANKILHWADLEYTKFRLVAKGDVYIDDIYVQPLIDAGVQITK